MALITDSWSSDRHWFSGCYSICKHGCRRCSSYHSSEQNEESRAQMHYGRKSGFSGGKSE